MGLTAVKQGDSRPLVSNADLSPQAAKSEVPFDPVDGAGFETSLTVTPDATFQLFFYYYQYIQNLGTYSLTVGEHPHAYKNLTASASCWLCQAISKSTSSPKYGTDTPSSTEYRDKAVSESRMK